MTKQLYKVFFVLMILSFVFVQSASALNENSVVTNIIIDEDGFADISLELTIPDMDAFTDTVEELQYDEYAVRELMEESYGIVSDVKVESDSKNRKIKITAKANNLAMEVGDVWKLDISDLALSTKSVLNIELPPNVKILKSEPRPDRTISDNSFMWTFDNFGSGSVELIYETTAMTWLKTKGLMGFVFLILIGGVVAVGGKKAKVMLNARSSDVSDNLSDIEQKLDMK